MTRSDATNKPNEPVAYVQQSIKASHADVPSNVNVRVAHTNLLLVGLESVAIEKKVMKHQLIR